MADVQVKCISKPDRQSSHESITHLGGDGWKWPRQKIISSIQDKSNTFYTIGGGKRAEVAVVNGANGPYVRTHADGEWNDNLLALPECVN